MSEQTKKEKTEYYDKVYNYMEYLMGGEQECGMLTIGWHPERVAKIIYFVGEPNYPNFRLAALTAIALLIKVNNSVSVQ